MDKGDKNSYLLHLYFTGIHIFTRVILISALLPVERCQTITSNGISQCFGHPLNCHLPDSNVQCDGLLIYSSTSGSDVNKTITLEIFGRAPLLQNQDSGFYTAAGISSDGKMTGSLIFECVRGSNNTITSYVAIAKGYEMPERLPPSDIANILNTTDRQMQSSEITCRFQVPNPLKIGSSNPATLIDFDARPYHLLISRGTVCAAGQLEYHGEDKSVSPVAVQLTGRSATEDENRSGTIGAGRHHALLRPTHSIAPGTSIAAPGKSTIEAMSAQQQRQQRQAPATSQLPIVTISPGSPPALDPYAMCTASNIAAKKCFALPKSTCIAAKNCDALLLLTSNSPDLVQAELVAFSREPSYVAMGLNRLSQMPGATIIDCRYPPGGRPALHLSHAVDRARPVPIVDVETVGRVLQLTRLEVNSKFFACGFDIQRQIQLSGPQYGNINLDLAKDDLNVLMARGPLDNQELAFHQDKAVVGITRVLGASKPTTAALNIDDGITSTSTTSPLITSSNESRLNDVAAAGVAQPISAGTGDVAVPYAKCGVSGGCLPLGDANCISTRSCHALILYQKQSALRTKRAVPPDNSTIIHFEVYEAQKTSGNYYVAVGFSHDGKMPNSAIVACIKNGNGQVSVPTLYAASHEQPMPVDLSSSIRNPQAELVNGVLKCSFDAASPIVTQGQTYDLNQPIYLLEARGDVGGDGTIQYHGSDKTPSASALDLTAFAVAQGGAAGGSDALIYAHATVMIVGWIFFASIGIFASQFCKPLWPTAKPCGLLLWFHIHRPFMMMTTLCALAGLVLIFIAIRDWSYSASNIHPFLGIVAIGFAFFNPIMAFFRPHPGDRWRLLFNLAHGFVGHVAHGLAIAAIILATYLRRFPLDRGAKITIWVFIGYEAIHYAIQIIIALMSRKREICGVGEQHEARGRTFTTTTTTSSNNTTNNNITTNRGRNWRGNSLCDRLILHDETTTIQMNNVSPVTGQMENERVEVRTKMAAPWQGIRTLLFLFHILACSAVTAVMLAYVYTSSHTNY